LLPQVPTTLQPWDSEGPLRVSINSFGYGGTNAHVILDDARSYLKSHNLDGVVRDTSSTLPLDFLAAHRDQTTNGTATNGHSNNRYIQNEQAINGHTAATNGHSTNDHSTNGFTNGHLSNRTNQSPRKRIFLLSANDEDTGKEVAKNLVEYIKKHQNNVADEWLDDLAFTLNERRSIFPWKAAVASQSVDKLVDALTSDLKFSKSVKSAVIGFVFTGQGAQWHAMGRELIGSHAVFRESLLKASRYLESIGAPWSLIGKLQSVELNISHMVVA